MNDGAAQEHAKSGGLDDRTLVITRLFPAPREAVFRAWTDPEVLAKWWGPEGLSTPMCEMDVRPGWAWNTCMQSAEGNKVFVGGEYLEITPPEKLVFTWAWITGEVRGHETVVTLEFIDRDGSTEMVLTQALFETAEQAGDHQGGWSSSFNCLKRYFLMERN